IGDHDELLPIGPSHIGKYPVVIVFSVVLIEKMNFLILSHQSITLNGEVEKPLVKITESFLFLRKLATIKFFIVHPLLVVRQTNISKHGGAGRRSKTGIFGTGFAHFLSKIDHGWRGAYGGRDHHGRFAHLGIAYKFGTGDTLFVMVFQKMTHVVLYVGQPFLV